MADTAASGTSAETTRSAQTQRYAAQFAALNDEVIATVSSCPDALWRQQCANDERPVAVVAHHIAETNLAFAGILGKLAAGDTYSPQISMEMVHQINAQHARDHDAVGKQESLDALRTNGAAIMQRLSELDNDLLGRTAGVFGGHEMTVAQVVEWVVIGDTAEHLASIRDTVAE